MRLPNSYGSITKLSGNRRKPWMVRITTGWEFDEHGMKVKQIQKLLGCYSSKQQAIKALSDYNDEPFDLGGRKVTFDEIWQKVCETDIPESSQRNYRAAYKYLAPITGMPINSIKTQHMQDCIDSCQTTQQTLIKACCHKVYNYALKKELIVKNPSQFLKTKKVEVSIEREVFTHEEIIELWKLRKQGLWWATVTLILLYSGLRTKELRTTTVESLDIENAWFDIPLAKNKSSVRGIPIHKDIIPLMIDYYANGGNLYGYTHSNLNRLLSEFHGHRAHDCRHTFTTRMRECGVDHLTIQRLLGHTPSDITSKIYTHISKEELHEAISMLEY